MTTPCSQQLHFGCLEESNFSCWNCMLKWCNREMSMTHVIEAEDFSKYSVLIYTEKMMSCCFTWRVMNVLYIGAGGLKICPNRVQNRICTFWVSPLPQQLHWTKQFQDQTANQLQKFTVVGYGNLGFSQRFKDLGGWDRTDQTSAILFKRSAWMESSSLAFQTNDTCTLPAHQITLAYIRFWDFSKCPF